MRLTEFSVKNYQFTIVIFAMVLALGAEDRDAAPVPAWLNVFELLARAPLTILGGHAGVARFRIQQP